jgi:hypothetical protein
VYVIVSRGYVIGGEGRMWEDVYLATDRYDANAHIEVRLHQPNVESVHTYKRVVESITRPGAQCMWCVAIDAPVDIDC